MAPDHDVEWLVSRSLTPRVCDHGAQVVRRHDLSSQPVDAFDVGEEAIPACRSPEWPTVGPGTCYPDRNPRLLDWPRQERGALDPVMSSVVVERLAAPEAGQDVQPFVKQVRPGPWV